MPQNKVIAVFGGSRPPADSREYAEAYTVGKLLAQQGFVVMNGGYYGTMEASARGAQEHGGHSIGVLSGEFAHLSANPYLSETQVSPDLFARIRAMQTRADGFIVLNGSLGTLAELALVWNLAKLDAAQRKPIILLGEPWVNVLRVWRSELLVTEEEAHLLQCARQPADAIELLTRWFVGG